MEQFYDLCPCTSALHPPGLLTVSPTLPLSVSPFLSLFISSQQSWISSMLRLDIKLIFMLPLFKMKAPNVPCHMFCAEHQRSLKPKTSTAAGLTHWAAHESLMTVTGSRYKKQTVIFIFISPRHYECWCYDTSVHKNSLSNSCCCASSRVPWLSAPCFQS